MKNRPAQHAVIIGAGYAGLAAGIALANKKIKTTILEKSAQIGYPVRCGGGSWIEDLEKLNIPKEYMHPINGVILVTPKHKIKFETKIPQMCVLNTEKVLKHLEEEFVRQGGNILLKHNVLTPVVNNNIVTGVEVLSSGKKSTINGDVFIDASGFSAVLAKKAGLQKKAVRFAAGGEYELAAPGFSQKDALLIFGYASIPSGYGWIFPCGGNRIRAGVGLINPKKAVNLQAGIKAMLEQLKKENAIKLESYKILEYHHGVISCDKPLKDTIREGLITVGDSAGQLSLLVGEGTRFALEVGRDTGALLAEHLIGKKDFCQFASVYRPFVRKKYYPGFLQHYYINKILAKLSPAQFDKIVIRASKVKPEYFFQLLKGNIKVSTVVKLLFRDPKSILSLIS